MRAIARELRQEETKKFTLSIMQECATLHSFLIQLHAFQSNEPQVSKIIIILVVQFSILLGAIAFHRASTI